MKCPDKNIIFDYLNDELNAEQAVAVSAHLAECESCRQRCELMQQQLAQVSQKLVLLEPAVIPEKRRIPLGKIRHRKPGFFKFEKVPRPHWRKIFAFAILAGCIVYGLVVKQNAAIEESPEKVRYLIEMEQEFMADPKQDVNENSFYISVFNPQKMEVKIERKSDSGETLARNIIQLK